MVQPACKCGCTQKRHYNDARSCMDCSCDGYVPADRIVSEEAKRRAADLLGALGMTQTLTIEELERMLMIAGSAFEEVLELRDSWYRDCHRMMRQRDGALEKKTKLQEALKRSDAEIGNLRNALDVALRAAAPSRPPAAAVNSPSEEQGHERRNDKT